MAVASALQQQSLICAEADEFLSRVDVFDSCDDWRTLTYGDYAECLGVGNYYPRTDLFDGFDVSSAAVTEAHSPSQQSATNQTAFVVYPWMRRRRHRRNGGNIFHYCLTKRISLTVVYRVKRGNSGT